MHAIAAAVGCTRELDGKISVAKDTDCFGYKTEKWTGTEPESPFLLAGLHSILRHCMDPGRELSPTTTGTANDSIKMDLRMPKWCHFSKSISN